MPKFFGCRPAGPTRQAAEKFENEIMIRHDSQQMVGTVYLDMQENAWAVAIAYNLSRVPGLHGHENGLEVRYSYAPGAGNTAQMYRSDAGTVTPLSSGPFADPDSFARYAIDHERAVATHAASNTDPATAGRSRFPEEPRSVPATTLKSRSFPGS